MPKQPRTAKQMKERRDSLRPHPARNQIIDVMRSYGQPISPTQLSKIIGFSLGSTAYHVRTLVSAGVVTLQEEGRVRGAVEHFYALASGDADLVDKDEQLLRFAGALTVPADDGGYPVPTILDARARKELARVQDRIVPRIRKIALDATRRARRSSGLIAKPSSARAKTPQAGH